MTDVFRQEPLFVQPLDGAGNVHEDRAEIGRRAEFDAGVDETHRIGAQGLGGVLGDQAQQPVPARRIGVPDHNDPGAQPLDCGLAEREFGQIHRRHRLSAVIEHSGHPFGSVGQPLQGQQRHNLDDAAGFERVTVFAELKDEEEHGSTVAIAARSALAGRAEFKTGDAGLEPVCGAIELVDGEVGLAERFGGLLGGLA